MKWEFGNMGSTSIKKHEMEQWEYGINLYQNMKCKFSDFQFKEHKQLKVIYFPINGMVFSIKGA